MKLKKLIIVRHADFNAGEEVGASQSKALATRLEPIIGVLSLVILTSTLERAWCTAKFICRKFGLRRYVQSDVLWWTTEEHEPKAPHSLELIEKYKDSAEVMIVVTHADYIDWLPTAFAEKFLDASLVGEDRGYARGWVIDCELITIEPV